MSFSLNLIKRRFEVDTDYEAIAFKCVIFYCWYRLNKTIVEI